jgi:peptidoglycan/xylan/chitin deacetylase (PgdA/CDA1 family)
VPLPRRAVLLTFDDGYADLVELARTMLQPRDIQALAFVVTGSQSGTNEWDQVYGAKTIALLSAEERIKLAALGVEIGSHSHTHSEMPLLDNPRQLAEAAGSAEALAAQGLPRPRFFAYPFGYSDESSREAIRSAEYLAAFGCRADWIDRGSDRFDLPRVVVLATDRGWRFKAKIFAPRLTAKVALVRGRISNRLRHLIGRHNGTH